MVSTIPASSTFSDELTTVALEDDEVPIHILPGVTFSLSPTPSVNMAPELVRKHRHLLTLCSLGVVEGQLMLTNQALILNVQKSLSQQAVLKNAAAAGQRTSKEGITAASPTSRSVAENSFMLKFPFAKMSDIAAGSSRESTTVTTGGDLRRSNSTGAMSGGGSVALRFTEIIQIPTQLVYSRASIATAIPVVSGGTASFHRTGTGGGGGHRERLIQSSLNNSYGSWRAPSKFQKIKVETTNDDVAQVQGGLGPPHPSIDDVLCFFRLNDSSTGVTRKHAADLITNLVAATKNLSKGDSEGIARIVHAEHTAQLNYFIKSNHVISPSSAKKIPTPIFCYMQSGLLRKYGALLLVPGGLVFVHLPSGNVVSYPFRKCAFAFERLVGGSQIRGLELLHIPAEKSSREVAATTGATAALASGSAGSGGGQYAAKVGGTSGPAGPSTSTAGSDYISDYVSSFFVFTTGREQAEVVEHLMDGQERLMVLQRSPELFQQLTGAWQKAQISNYHYLDFLNCLGGRSTQHLSFYPVFPWVARDYETLFDSNQIKPMSPSSRQPDAPPTLTKPVACGMSSNYRDLSKPIGALSHERLESLLQRMSCLPRQDQYLFGSHYSTPAYVAHWRIRDMPEWHLKLNEGKIDQYPRLFHSVPESWSAVLKGQSAFMELSPEFFRNDPGFLLPTVHVSAPEGSLADVILPNGCSCPFDASAVVEACEAIPGASFTISQEAYPIEDLLSRPGTALLDALWFLFVHRCILEGGFVSRRLHKWIDLMFGSSQFGEGAEESFNLFHPVTYYTSRVGKTRISPIFRVETSTTTAGGGSDTHARPPTGGATDGFAATLSGEENSRLRTSTGRGTTGVTAKAQLDGRAARQILEFGQAPIQLFSAPHAPRRVHPSSLLMSRHTSPEISRKNLLAHFAYFVTGHGATNHAAQCLSSRSWVALVLETMVLRQAANELTRTGTQALAGGPGSTGPMGLSHGHGAAHYSMRILTRLNTTVSTPPSSNSGSSVLAAAGKVTTSDAAASDEGTGTTVAGGTKGVDPSNLDTKRADDDIGATKSVPTRASTRDSPAVLNWAGLTSAQQLDRHLRAYLPVPDCQPPKLFTAHDGRIAAASPENQRLEIYSLQSLHKGAKDGKLTVQPDHQISVQMDSAHDSITALAFAPTGGRVVLGKRSGGLSVYHLADTVISDQKLGHSQGGHRRAVVSLAADSESSNRMATGSLDESVAIWDLDSLRVQSWWEQHESPVIALAVSGSWLFSGAADGTLVLRDCTTPHWTPPAWSYQLDEGLVPAQIRVTGGSLVQVVVTSPHTTTATTAAGVEGDAAIPVRNRVSPSVSSSRYSSMISQLWDQLQGMAKTRESQYRQQPWCSVSDADGDPGKWSRYQPLGVLTVDTRKPSEPVSLVACSYECLMSRPKSRPASSIPLATDASGKSDSGSLRQAATSSVEAPASVAGSFDHERFSGLNWSSVSISNDRKASKRSCYSTKESSSCFIPATKIKLPPGVPMTQTVAVEIEGSNGALLAGSRCGADEGMVLNLVDLSDASVVHTWRLPRSEPSLLAKAEFHDTYCCANETAGYQILAYPSIASSALVAEPLRPPQTAGVRDHIQASISDHETHPFVCLLDSTHPAAVTAEMFV